jgi:hypothetical protein
MAGRLKVPTATLIISLRDAVRDFIASLRTNSVEITA